MLRFNADPVVYGTDDLVFGRFALANCRPLCLLIPAASLRLGKSLSRHANE
jgi:hypothetical protein